MNGSAMKGSLSVTNCHQLKLEAAERKKYAAEG